ncbi:uroporphyrinogen decarboxylase family protein [Marispirochaeta sp.]|uniref:uroporphyrinogen decarboxylase family protein n=1 Tax=Marispirochaeta sp. TaxID=2038653 RepID=UPI0029C8E736|nr:uroporphyrinogen decarboxylase family protein [Marispirochaeta sp.]
MNGNTRVRTALEYKDGPVPVDFGGMPTTGIHVTIIEAVRDYYGLEKRPVKVHEPYQMLGLLDDDLKEVLGVDSEILWNPYTFYGFKMGDWKEWRAPWGQELLVPGEFNVTGDASGAIFMYPEGDTAVPPSAVMPAGGFFFDSITRQPPIDDDALDPEDNLEEFGPVGEDVLEYLRLESERIRNSGRYVVANFGGTAIGDIACVPAPALKAPRGIRDVTEWYVSTAMRQDYLHQVFEKQTEIALVNLKKIHEIVGDVVGAAYICGTDFGTQNGPFCAPQLFTDLYMLYYKKINDWVHANTKWKSFKHSCGSVEPFMALFIDAGFDILNPLQFSAAGMDPQFIKQTYGRRIVFWGGGVDTQHVLPFGTPDDVERQVYERCSILSKGGGFVFNTIHNVQARTPVENFVRMIDTVHRFNRERGFV